MEENRESISYKGIIKAVLIAVVFLVGGELLLAWQYHRLEQDRLPEIEQQLEEQQQSIEEQAARAVLKNFMDARVAGDEAGAARYITEGAMQQKTEGSFELLGLENYTIEKSEKIDENVFRFQVEAGRQNAKQLEIVVVKKILEDYYIDSVQLTG